VGEPTSAGLAYRFESRALNRLLGRGGRIADTPDPARYFAVFRRLRNEYDSRFHYGFMLPVNLLLNGVVNHPIYSESRVPQMAPLAIFNREREFWRVRAAISIVRRADTAIEDRLLQLYSDFGVSLIVISPELVDSGYLDGAEFNRQLKDALFFTAEVQLEPACQPAAVA
jgi:hypothetical protein